MIGVDTSVVLRYLVGSPPDQASRAKHLIEAETDIGISLIVLLETGHVLRTQYGVSRADILDALVGLLTRSNVSTIGAATQDVIAALVRARSLPGTPIPDALIVLTSRLAGALPIYTFDTGLRRHGSAVATP